MRQSNKTHNREFDEMVGDLSQAIHEMSDPVAIATMLYSIAEEKKSSNLVVRDINGKFDQLMQKLTEVAESLKNLNETIKSAPKPANGHPATEPSERDQEVLDFVAKQKRACAEELQEQFHYRGRNAASARLSKLFKEGKLKKIYVGRKVYYTLK
jgi:predicted HTH transcriptional regulator